MGTATSATLTTGLNQTNTPAWPKTATFGLGWFWNPDEDFSAMDGVLSTRVGYTGGSNPKPTYESVCAGDGHTEAIQITYDPSKVAYASLVDKFISSHDPCASGQVQYMSAVWPAASRRGRPFATKIMEPKQWYDAEEYHQKYIQKN